MGYVVVPADFRIFSDVWLVFIEEESARVYSGIRGLPRGFNYIVGMDDGTYNGYLLPRIRDQDLSYVRGNSTRATLMDKGRIKLSDYMMSRTGIEKGEDVLIIGNGDWFEIWSPETRKSYEKSREYPISRLWRYILDLFNS